ncbi:actin nucleation-promoting factor WASL-like [Cydia strobilella]|uniref:actin nucleation-promoting factor WASL-like n=1 Tax=Cydia strobilella TaxID=1100964 RepID=UPI003005AA02
MMMCSQIKHYGGVNRCPFITDELVLYKNFTNKKHFTWTLGTIVKNLGRVLYLIKDNKTNKIVKRHVNQVVKYKGQVTPTAVSHPEPNKTPECFSESSSPDVPPVFDVGPTGVPSMLAGGPEAMTGQSPSHEPVGRNNEDELTMGEEEGARPLDTASVAAPRPAPVPAPAADAGCAPPPPPPPPPPGPAADDAPPDSADPQAASSRLKRARPRFDYKKFF